MAMNTAFQTLAAVSLAALLATFGAFASVTTPPLNNAFDLDMPVSPTPITIAGCAHLVYELHTRSFASKPLIIERVTVMDAKTGAELRAIDGENLTQRLGPSIAGLNQSMKPLTREQCDAIAENPTTEETMNTARRTENNS